MVALERQNAAGGQRLQMAQQRLHAGETRRAAGQQQHVAGIQRHHLGQQAQAAADADAIGQEGGVQIGQADHQRGVQNIEGVAVGFALHLAVDKRQHLRRRRLRQQVAQAGGDFRPAVQRIVFFIGAEQRVRRA